METVTSQVFENQTEVNQSISKVEHPDFETEKKDKTEALDESDEDVLPIFLCLQALRGC